MHDANTSCENENEPRRFYHTGRGVSAAGVLTPVMESFGKNDRVGVTFNAHTGRVSLTKNGCAAGVLYTAADFSEPMALVVSTFGKEHRVRAQLVDTPTFYERNFNAYAQHERRMGRAVNVPAEFQVASSSLDDDEVVAFMALQKGTGLTVATLPVPTPAFHEAQIKKNAVKRSIEMVSPFTGTATAAVTCASDGAIEVVVRVLFLTFFESVYLVMEVVGYL